MRKLNIFIIVSIVLMTMLIGNVVAMTQHEQETYNKIDFLWSKLKYAMEKGFFLFTSWGQANCCATDIDGYCEQTGDYVGYDEKWSYGTERVDCDDGGCSYNKCAIDTWAEIICLGGQCSHSSPSYNNYIGEENGIGASFVGYASNQWYFSEIYCCPQSCPIEPTHDTRAYKCDDGEWDSIGRYDLDEYCQEAGSGNNYQCWCADEEDNFYIDESGGVHCRESDYYKITDGTWCPEFEEHAYYTCYNDDIYWYDDDNDRNDKKEDCGSLGCVTGSEECREEGEELPNGEIIEPGCVEDEEIFYTNIQGTYVYGNILGKISEQLGQDDVDTLRLNPYFENKAVACCDGFEYTYLDEKELKGEFGLLFGLIASAKLDGSVDKYKCVEEGEVGFCLEFAHKLLNPYTKTDDCQTNTIILIVLLIGGFIAISRFAG